MTREQLKTVIGDGPFRPFRLRTVSGFGIHVPHEDCIFFPARTEVSSCWVHNKSKPSSTKGTLAP